MKQIRFESNNKQWLVVDLPCDDAELLGRMDNFYWSYSSKSTGWGKIPMIGKFKKISYIKEITKEQASEVVGNLNGHGYFNYNIKQQIRIVALKSTIESLHSLLKSKGVDFNNGNWYLFKKV